MSDKNSEKEKTGFDLIGLGKTAEAIPEEVYIKTTRTLTNTFDKIVSPITETTSGVGRYIRQKFDNMVEAEKAIAAFTIQNAIKKAQQRSDVLPPKHLKSFINSFEEASKETDPTLHEMWENILANQLIDSDFHPRYINILSNFSASEANLLLMLNPWDELGEDFSGYFVAPRDAFDHFVIKNYDKNLHQWTYSCNILLEFELAEVTSPKDGIYDKADKVTILYRTKSGTRFLKVVTMK